MTTTKPQQPDPRPFTIAVGDLKDLAKELTFEELQLSLETAFQPLELWIDRGDAGDEEIANHCHRIELRAVSRVQVVRAEGPTSSVDVDATRGLGTITTEVDARADLGLHANSGSDGREEWREEDVPVRIVFTFAPTTHAIFVQQLTSRGIAISDDDSDLEKLLRGGSVVLWFVALASFVWLGLAVADTYPDDPPPSWVARELER